MVNELTPFNSPLLLLETIRMNDIMVVEHLGDQLDGSSTKYMSRELQAKWNFALSLHSRHRRLAESFFYISDLKGGTTVSLVLR